MPRKARIDAPGALHHIIVRGIDRKNIFLDDTDREDFLDRLSAIIDDTQTACFSWAIMPNHFHLLLRTGNAAISRVMQRLLTGYAISFNRRHDRQGHLFQNRYKSILCQEEAYLLELVRYIHLNPLRAKIVRNLKELREYPYCGHSAFFKKGYHTWQHSDYILKKFNPSVSIARRQYREFVEKGVDQGRRDELVGGGLIRSAGGWTAAKTLQKAGYFKRNDERILGDGDFVEKVLSLANEKMERCYRLQAQGVNFQTVIRRAGELTGVDPDAILLRDRGRRTVQARSLACYWAAEELGLKQPEIGLTLGMTQAAVSMAIQRGKLFAAENYLTLE
jgi:REP element-mobilizing transposase RayT